MTLLRRQLGAFVLEQPIARGGMGEVWTAHHRRQGTRVAVKVLRTDDPAMVAAIANESRAVAGLHHPNIIWVHDFGTVPKGIPDLHPGTPWLAMELADEGHLGKRRATMGWPEIRETVLDLLDALAHAHARGVVHRDIKPANILFGGSRPGSKLTDFGMVLARQHVEEGGVPLTGGSPRYMAPEQFMLSWSDQGPWTDLYALGCLTWSLVCGRAPYSGTTYRELYEQHWNQPIPVLLPRIAVPDGLEAWVRQLMAKAPDARPQLAADAALALAQLPPVSLETGSLPAVDGDAPTLIRARGTTLFRPEARVRRPADPVLGQPCPPPPIPADWRPPRTPRPPMALVGAGLGLYGLRGMPPVGREAERDLLWSALRDVHREKRTRGVVLRGPAGCGKSHLAQWLCCRAREVGAAAAMRATHGERPGPMDGLAGMLARDTRVPGLPAEDFNDLLDRLEPEQDTRAVLQAVLGPFTAEGIAAPVSATQRRNAARAWIRRRLSQRPVVIWIDDAQWGLDALQFVREEVMGQDMAVLVVCTVREESLAERPAAAYAVEALCAHPSVRSLTIGALPDVDARALIDHLLSLDEALLDQLTRRVGGNPLFALQLIGDWVERGVLVAGRHGFRLARGVEPSLPGSLAEVWSARIDHLVAGRQAWQTALQLAAVLGQEVDPDEWRDAAEILGCDAPEELVAALLQNRLATTDAAGNTWSFVHGMLREAIEPSAGPVLKRMHTAVAQMLGTRSRTNARQGRHLVAADAYEQALRPLCEGAYDVFEEGDFAEMERLLTDRDGAMRAAGLPASDERWGGTWNYRARQRYSLGNTDEAFTWWDRTLEAARTYGWQQERMVALYDTSLVLSTLGDSAKALERCREAVEVAATLDKPEHLANARYHVCSAALIAGHIDEAVAALELALPVFEDLGNQVRVFDCYLELGRAADMQGNQPLARHRFDAALGVAQEVDVPVIKVRAWFMQGDHRRLWGDWEGAEQAMERAVDLAAQMGGKRWPYLVRLQLALVKLHLGKDQTALNLLQACTDADLAEHRLLADLGWLLLSANATSVAFEKRFSAVEQALAGSKVEAQVAFALQDAAQRTDGERRARLSALSDDAGTRARQGWKR
jgi:eukaryotic-like serine/threonine-protein kinase